MKNIKVLGLGFALVASLLATRSRADAPAAPAAAFTPPKDAVVVVDKKNNQINLCDYDGGKLVIAKTYRATFGKSTGDKLWEGDLKTPEGIYDFAYFKRPPALGKKFGPLALGIGYPNAMDKRGKQTGSLIMLHGTDDPSRLERAFDSLGCVVTDNDNVKEIAEYVKTGATKIIITREWDTLKNQPRLEKAKVFLDAWLNAWSAKDLPGYIYSYAEEYIPQQAGRNRNDFARYKDSLNKKYGTIKVSASDVHFFFHEKYDLVTFTQHYNSTFPNGAPAYTGVSRKNLFIQERNGYYRIVMEENSK
jgi:murein L,D-transpeptidase YafK